MTEDEMAGTYPRDNFASTHGVIPHYFLKTDINT